MQTFHQICTAGKQLQTSIFFLHWEVIADDIKLLCCRGHQSSVTSAEKTEIAQEISPRTIFSFLRKTTVKLHGRAKKLQEFAEMDQCFLMNNLSDS